MIEQSGIGEVVKSVLMSEIENQLAFYQNKLHGIEEEKRGYKIFGSLKVLEDLKNQVGTLDPNNFDEVGIVKEIKTDTILPPASILNAVLNEIEYISQDTSIDGDPGGGSNPDAVPGRIEVCKKMIKFVKDVDSKLKNKSNISDLISKRKLHE